MSGEHAVQVQAVMEASVDIAAILSTRIYLVEETGRKGLSSTSVPAAYIDGVLQPTAVIRERSQVSTFDIQDSSPTLASYNSMVEIWLYRDGSDDPNPLRQVQSLVFGLLHQKNIAGVTFYWAEDQDLGREEEMQNAFRFRSLYLAHAIRST